MSRGRQPTPWSRLLWPCAAAVLSLSACTWPGATKPVSTPAAPSPRVLWRLPLAAGGFFRPAFPVELASPVANAAGSSLFIGSSGSSFQRLASYDGAVEWSQPMPGGVMARATLDGGAVYVGSDDGALTKLDEATGKELWRHTLKAVVRSQPLVTQGRVFFSGEDDAVYALDAASGEWLWEHRREAPDDFTISGVAAPRLQGDRVFAGFSDGTLVALRANDGSVLWTAHLAERGRQFSDVDQVLPWDERTLFAASSSGGLWAFDPASGDVRWHTPALRSLTLLERIDERLFAGTGEGDLYEISPSDGKPLWQARYGGRTLRALQRHGRWLVASSEGLGLLLLDPAQGALRGRFDPGSGVASPILSLADKLFFLSGGGYLYGLELR